MPAALITLAHLSVSSAMSLPNSAGESDSTSRPRSVVRLEVSALELRAWIPEFAKAEADEAAGRENVADRISRVALRKRPRRPTPVFARREPVVHADNLLPDMEAHCPFPYISAATAARRVLHHHFHNSGVERKARPACDPALLLRRREVLRVLDFDTIALLRRG
jgi:hypothetical protein